MTNGLVAGRTAIVTGAAQGIGLAIACLLHEHGANVALVDLDADRAKSAAAELGGSVLSLGCDVTDAEAVEAVVSRTVDEFGALDIYVRAAGGQAVANYDSVATEDGAAGIVATAVDEFGGVHGIVNNAGILRDKGFQKMTAAEWDVVVQVHLYGGFHVTKAAWPYFREQQHGRMVMATSTSGVYGNFGQSNYGAAKAGLVGLVNTLAIEGARYNILANAVAPMAATRMTSDIAPAELLAKLPPAHVAPIVGYLMTDECTDSGSVLVAGGGQVHRVQYFQSPGVTFDEIPTVDEVADRWKEITDMTNSVPGVNPVG
jgi:NAD(P)-dependent dehydrogenase (short-subunit alcohol dehydrogenase family)